MRQRTNYFERNIEPVTESGCWIWVGTITNIGYGKVGVAYKTISAHRYSYTKYIGEIPEGKLVLHKCDIRCCVNPNHLFLGNQSDNIKDMYAKNRGKLSSRIPE